MMLWEGWAAALVDLDMAPWGKVVQVGFTVHPADNKVVRSKTVPALVAIQPLASANCGLNILVIIIAHYEYAKGFTCIILM